MSTAAALPAETPATRWRLAVRVATVTATLGATGAGALHHFLGTDGRFLVAAAAAVALAVGSRLPAAAPVGRSHGDTC
jgi:hypothetical protein